MGLKTLPDFLFIFFDLKHLLVAYNLPLFWHSHGRRLQGEPGKASPVSSRRQHLPPFSLFFKIFFFTSHCRGHWAFSPLRFQHRHRGGGFGPPCNAKHCPFYFYFPKPILERDLATNQRETSQCRGRFPILGYQWGTMATLHCPLSTPLSDFSHCCLNCFVTETTQISLLYLSQTIHYI